MASGLTRSGIDSLVAESEPPPGRPIRTGLRRRLPVGGRRNRRRCQTSRNRTGRRSSARCTPRSGVTSPAGEGSERPPCGQAEPWFLLHLPTLASPARMFTFDDCNRTDPWALRYGYANRGAAYILPEAAPNPNSPTPGVAGRGTGRGSACRNGQVGRQNTPVGILLRGTRRSLVHRLALVASCNSICSRLIPGCRLRSFSSALRTRHEAE